MPASARPVRGRGLDDQSYDFTVVIPAYNEAQVIDRVLGGLGKLADRRFEIIVVDDGSSDGTAAAAEAAMAGLDEAAGACGRVVRHPYNMGNGAAVKTGIRQARGERILFMDADGQHAVDDLPRLLASLDRFDMAVGARSKESQAGWHRRLANGFYNRFASYVARRPIKDLTSGFRGLRREVARRYVSLLPNGFSYPTTITLCLMRGGFSVDYIPIEARRREGKSKIKLLSDGSKFLLVILKICMLFSPMRISLPVSLYLFLMGVGYYAFTFVTEHRFTNMSMLLFTTSVTVFMMGLIAEQIAQMRFERSEDR